MIIGVNPAATALSMAQLEQGELQPGAHAGEEVEAGAGDLGAAVGVDGPEPFAEREVVQRLEPLGGEVARGADLAQDHVVLLPAGRRPRLDDVVDPAHGGLELVARGVHLALQGLDAVGELARVRQQTVPLLALGTRDLLAEGLLLCARALELGERRAPPLVGREHGVDQALVGSPGALAGADGVRILTEVAQVDHVLRLVDGSGVHARTPARGLPPAGPVTVRS